MNQNLALQIKSLNLDFGERKIYSDFSMELKFAESCCLVAPSGFGKSSLLNVIMGFLKANFQSIKVCGIEYNRNNISIIRKKIAWLPQGFNFNPSLKVFDVLNMPFSYHANRKYKPEKSKLVYNLNMLNLDENILSNEYGQISGGEKQRIGIIICKLLNRPLLLLDEPSSALDKESKSRVISYLLKDGNSAILSCSHDEEWIDSSTFSIDLNREALK